MTNGDGLPASESARKPDPAADRRVGDARETVLQYLSGGMFDSHALRAALETLAELAPGEAERLVGDEQTQPVSEDCLNVEDCLDEYRELGGRAAAAAAAADAMPEVAAHVSSCPRCSNYLAMLRSLDCGGWLELSHRLARPAQLVYARDAWYWREAGASAAERAIRKVSEQDLVAHAVVGDFVLDRAAVPAWGGHWAGENTLPLSYELPGETASLTVEVTPRHCKAEGRTMLSLLVKLRPSSSVQEAVVSVLRGSQAVTGERTITAAADARYELTPLPQPEYALCVKWQTPDGRENEPLRLELPVCEAAT